jgi:hypothetical protein
VCLLAEQEDAGIFKIQAIAVSIHYRGRGGAHGDEAMDVALETAAERGRKSGADTVLVVGWIDPRNYASKRLNQRAGFAHRRNTPFGLEEWVLALEIG